MKVSHPIPCLICGQALDLRTARGRRSGKPFIMLICPIDGRHFRGFITDQTYVTQVLARLERHTRPNEPVEGEDALPPPPVRPGASSEPGSGGIQR